MIHEVNTCSWKVAIAFEVAGMLFKTRRTAETKTFLGTHACIDSGSGAKDRSKGIRRTA